VNPNSFDYLTELLRHSEELKVATVGVDALELPRLPEADGQARKAKKMFRLH